MRLEFLDVLFLKEGCCLKGGDGDIFVLVLLVVGGWFFFGLSVVVDGGSC